jgi:hypothetical protein
VEWHRRKIFFSKEATSEIFAYSLRDLLPRILDPLTMPFISEAKKTSCEE